MTMRELQRAVEALGRAWHVTGGIPPNIVEVYKKALAEASPGMRRRFFEALWTKAPGAAEIFFNPKDE